MADYSGLFGQYSNLQQPTQDPFAPLLAPPPPVAPPPPALPRPKPANPYEARQQEAMDAANAASMAAAMKQQAHQDAIIAKTSANEAQRANRERETEEMRAKVFADVDAKQQALINEATQGEKVDPRGRFGNAGTGAKLALGVMGFLQGFIDPKGGPGKMAAWVDNIVQKDIATQMANIEQKNRVLGLKQSALDKGVARDSAMLDAQLAATARAYDGAQRIIAAEAAKNPAMAEMAQAAQAELQMKMQEKFEQNRQENRRIGIQAAGVALQRRAQDMNWAQGEMDRAERVATRAQAANAAGAAEQGKAAAAQKPLEVPGVIDPATKQTWVAADKEDAKEARATMRGLSYVDGLLKRRDKLREEYGSETLPSEGKDRMKKLDQQLMLAVKDAEKTGTLDEGSVKFLKEYLGDTDRFSSISAQNDEIRNGMIAKAQAHLASLGFTGEVTPIPLRQTSLDTTGLLKPTDQTIVHAPLAPLGFEPMAPPKQRPLGMGDLPPWAR